MATGNSSNISEQDLLALEARVDDLIRACSHLKEENKALRAHEEQLLRERARLLEKTDLARTRVEAMIGRLRSLEAET